MRHKRHSQCYPVRIYKIRAQRINPMTMIQSTVRQRSLNHRLQSRTVPTIVALMSRVFILSLRVSTGVIALLKRRMLKEQKKASQSIKVKIKKSKKNKKNIKKKYYRYFPLHLTTENGTPNRINLHEWMDMYGPSQTGLIIVPGTNGVTQGWDRKNTSWRLKSELFMFALKNRCSWLSLKTAVISGCL